MQISTFPIIHQVFLKKFDGDFILKIAPISNQKKGCISGSNHRDFKLKPTIGISDHGLLSKAKKITTRDTSFFLV